MSDNGWRAQARRQAALLARVRAIEPHAYERGTHTHPALRNPMCAACGYPIFHAKHVTTERN